MSEIECTGRAYGRLVPEAHKRGIGRTKAYELEKAGLLETFSIGRAKFVYIDSLDSLPQRANSQAQRDAA